MLTVTGKEKKNENIKRKNLTVIQGEFQRTDSLETKENKKLEATQRSKPVSFWTIFNSLNA